MPLYEYECRPCGHRFEYLVLHSSPAAQCPLCHREDLEQVISLCAVSSESTRQANLSRANAKMAAIRNEKARESHEHLHEHHDH